MKRIENNNQLLLADCLDRIFNEFNAVKIPPKGLLDTLDTEIKYVAERLHVGKTGAVLLPAILVYSSRRFGCEDENLADYLGITPIKFLQFQRALKMMQQSGAIHIVRSHGNRTYRVSKDMMRAIEGNEEFVPIKRTGLDSETLFLRIGQLYTMFRTDDLDADSLIEELDDLVSNNKQLVFCSKALDSALYSQMCTATERRMFYLMCMRYVLNGDSATGIDLLMNYTSDMESNARCANKIQHERTTLQTSGLVCFAINDGFADTDALSLSDSVKADFFSEIELSEKPVVHHRDLVMAKDIAPKQLFFNDKENRQLDEIARLLDNDRFAAVQKRLDETGMRSGFNIVFYGGPGTGKTASVYELARRTGRDVFRVDVTKLRSKWVGDSEKSVRGLFHVYRSLCKDSTIAPILLFNEADAIFARRFDNPEHSVDQMNNTLQNIILEEMENLNGILIATTNLLSNLDPAFERRFIFKVEFRQPEKESRARIWKSMIDTLSDDDALQLADKYAFAGGNIENIARRSTVEYVLSGNRPTVADLMRYCDEEIINRNKTRKIGF